MPLRDTIIAANWKMYKTIEEGIAFVQALIPHLADLEPSHKIYIATPFTALREIARKAEGTAIVVGAQNMHDANEGAFTGEIAAEMLVDAGANFVILGHSERRHVFGETSAFVNRKVLQAFHHKLQPIVCVGETLEDRKAEKSEAVVAAQLQETLAGVQSDQAASMIIAYEPVWAIGTGETATPEMAEAMHSFIRRTLEGLFGKEIAEKIVIQYGGSVKPANAAELMRQPNIDGLLVGGASLDPESFQQIINYQNNKKGINA